METNNTAKSLLSGFLCLALALAVSLGAGILFGDKAKKGTDAELTAAINAAAEGNAGYEDITDAYIPQNEKGVSLYLIKSGTGGKDVYCARTTAKSRGCTVDALTTFSADGVIMSVRILSAKGGNGNGADIIEKSGILSHFGGVPYDSDVITVNSVTAAGGFDDAVVISVNKACGAISKVLYVEEESE